jgi:hypothetical protein
MLLSMVLAVECDTSCWRGLFQVVQLLISADCTFDASLVPETCPDRLVDSKELINKFLESRETGQVPSLGLR